YLLSVNKIYRWIANKKDTHYSLSMKYNDSASMFGYFTAATDKDGNVVTASNKLVLLTKDKVITQPLDYMVDQITVDNKNRVWAASRSNRLFCFQISDSDNQATLSLQRKFDSVVKSSPRSITADKDGNIWIGTRDEGLFCLQFNGLNI